MSSSLVHDVRFAFRGVLKTPGLTFVVVLTLAVAIGANTAIFSVVESVLLKPLPYPDEDRIVRVAATVRESAGARGDRGNSFSDRGYWHFFNNQRSFEKFGGYWGRGWFPLTGEGPPRRVGEVTMTLGAFEVLGVIPGARPAADARGRLARRTRRPAVEPRSLGEPLRRRSCDSRQDRRAERHAARSHRRHARALRLSANLSATRRCLDAASARSRERDLRRSLSSRRSPGSRRASREKRRSVMPATSSRASAKRAMARNGSRAYSMAAQSCARFATWSSAPRASRC